MGCPVSESTTVVAKGNVAPVANGPVGPLVVEVVEVVDPDPDVEGDPDPVLVVVGGVEVIADAAGEDE